MKKIYLHLGLPKTGTSYLQSCFAYNEDNYKSHGLIYPNISEDNEKSMSGNVGSGNGLSFAKKIIPALNQYPSNFDVKSFFSNLDPSYDYLISSEWLININLKDIEEINKLTAGSHCVHLIIFYRPMSQLFVSAYLQLLKNGLDKKFEEAFDLIESNVGNNFKKIVSLCKTYSSYSILSYGSGDVNLLKLDNIFFGKEGVSKKISLEKVNLSPEVHQISILELINKLGISNFGLNTKYIDSTFNTRAPKFFISNDQIRFIEDRFDDDINELNALLDSENKYKIELKSISFKSLSQSLDINECDLKHIKMSIQHKFQKEKNKILKDQNEILKNHKEIIDFLEKINDYKKSCNSTELPHDFDPLKYLFLNRDLISAKQDPFIHYLTFGKTENRRYK